MTITLPDGREVTEIVLPDGSTATQVIAPDGSVVFEAASAIPDSAIAQYDVAQVSATDGETIQSLSDQINSFDLTGGDPVYRSSSSNLNSNPTLDFDGTDDFLDEGSLTESSPLTIIAVIANTGLANEVAGTADRSPTLEANQTGTDNTLIQGDADFITGNATNNQEISVGVFDGALSLIRQNGTQTASGGIGAAAFSGMALGSYGNQSPFDGEIGEVVVYNEALSTTDIESEEQRLSDKWGVTI